MSETHQPPSQMLRVPTALIDAVKELSRLYREGYTHAVITGVQQLIANLIAIKISMISTPIANLIQN
jgi:hypothetical protein